MSKVIYLLGAGASYNSVPIIARSNNRLPFGDYYNTTLQDAHASILNYFDDKVNNQTINKNINSLNELIVKYINTPTEYNTPDTFAKALSFKYDYNDVVHKEYKLILSIFFTYFSHYKRQFFNDKFDFTDKRYLGWLSYLLEKTENKLEINKNVSILSWNYDNEIEKTILNYLSSHSPENKFDPKDFSMVNFRYDYRIFTPLLSQCNAIFADFTTIKESPSLIKLNGSSSLFYKRDSNEFNYYDFDIYNNSFDESKIESRFESLFDNVLIPFFDKQTGHSMHQDLSFGWEQRLKGNILNLAKKTAGEGNVLIVFGYSFPAYNREIDKAIINSFIKDGGKKKIHIQTAPENFDSIKQKIKGMIEAENQDNISFINQKDLTEIYIPLEL